jgi:phosphotransferase system  glucose/maltose/N-acetylglucosamine-specific IIC component
MERIFDLSTLLAIFGGGTIFSALGFAVGLAYQPSTAAKRAGEAWLVSIVGGFLAHAFISTLLDCWWVGPSSVCPACSTRLLDSQPPIPSSLRPGCC